MVRAVPASRAIPATFKAALEHPGRFAVWGRMFRMLEDVDGKRDEFDAAEPDWMRSGWLRLPFGTEQGKLLLRGVNVARL